MDIFITLSGNVSNFLKLSPIAAAIICTMGAFFNRGHAVGQESGEMAVFWAIYDRMFAIFRAGAVRGGQSSSLIYILRFLAGSNSKKNRT